MGAQVKKQPKKYKQYEDVSFQVPRTEKGAVSVAGLQKKLRVSFYTALRWMRRYARERDKKLLKTYRRVGKRGIESAVYWVR